MYALQALTLLLPLLFAQDNPVGIDLDCALWGQYCNSDTDCCQWSMKTTCFSIGVTNICTPCGNNPGNSCTAPQYPSCCQPDWTCTNGECVYTPPTNEPTASTAAPVYHNDRIGVIMGSVLGVCLGAGFIMALIIAAILGYAEHRREDAPRYEAVVF